MAGDLDIEEQVFILPRQAAELSASLEENLRQEGVRIFHRYGPRVMIGEVPIGQGQRVRAALNALEVTAAPDELSSIATADLDPVGALGLAAFSLRKSLEYVKAKEERPFQNVEWGAGGGLPPDPPPEHQALVEAPTPARSRAGGLIPPVMGDTSDRMTGKIAVGIIIVSGPTFDLQFSEAERIKVMAEVQSGLGWFALNFPVAKITWSYDPHSLQVNVMPGSGPNKEYLWRDPAMVQLGYKGDWYGVFDYVDHIKEQLGTNWAYVAFFTKYPLDHFAYANRGGPRLVMNYANDGWGPDSIDIVFAHETGHIFQAEDEYSTTDKCNCGGSFGIYGQPNGNCEVCAPGGGYRCIMRGNFWDFCAWTPLHYGIPHAGPGVNFDKSMGATTVDGVHPYAFVRGADGKLWANWLEEAWRWSNLGQPSHVNIESAIGAVTVKRAAPYVFIKGNDGNLWVNWWGGGSWNWTNNGQPNGITFTESMGVVVVDTSQPYAFVKGSDGNLWLNWLNGTTWTWSNQGRPNIDIDVEGSMGTVILKGASPYVFIKGSDGNLWVSWWDGGWHWTNLSRPNGIVLGESMGATVVDTSQPYVFVKGSDGNLWVNWLNGTVWNWWNLKRPYGVIDIEGSMGTAILKGKAPYVFIKGSDGNLWVNWWAGTGWEWTDQGRPTDISLTDSMDVTEVDGRPYAFVKGSDGNLWVNWYDGTEWIWSNQWLPS